MNVLEQHPESTATAKGRVLVIHNDPNMRQMLVQTVIRSSASRFAVSESESLESGFASARRLRPQIVLIDLCETPYLALDIVRKMRADGYHIIGVYNPGLFGKDESRFLRIAVRAGVRDFLSVPPSDLELKEVLDSVKGTSGPSDAGEGGDGNVVCFFSHKGGAGTSTLALNYALAEATIRPEAKVVLMDADFQFGNLAGLLNMANNPGLMALRSELDHPGPMESYMERHPSGLSLLSRPSSLLDAELITPEHLSRILLVLSGRFDTIVVDLPRVLDLNTFAAMDLAETIYLVTVPVRAVLEEAVQVIDVLKAQGFSADRLRITLNQTTPDTGYMSLQEAQIVLGQKCHIAVEHDPRCFEAVSRRIPVSAMRGSPSPISQWAMSQVQPKEKSH